MPVPLIALAALATTAYSAIDAGVKNSKERKRLAEIEKNKKNITTPSIIEEYAANPVTAENRQFIADQAAQRVGTSVGAMAKGGLTSMGGLSTMMANEARNDSKLQSDFSQLQREAALVGGQYAARTQDAARRDWEQQMIGSQTAIADNNKVMQQALMNTASTALAADYAGVFDSKPSVKVGGTDGVVGGDSVMSGVDNGISNIADAVNGYRVKQPYGMNTALNGAYNAQQQYNLDNPIQPPFIQSPYISRYPTVFDGYKTN